MACFVLVQRHFYNYNGRLHAAINPVERPEYVPHKKPVGLYFMGPCRGIDSNIHICFLYI